MRSGFGGEGVERTSLPGKSARERVARRHRLLGRLETLLGTRIGVSGDGQG